MTFIGAIVIIIFVWAAIMGVSKLIRAKYHNKR